MPGFPFPGRPGGEPDEPLLDMIIAGRVLPPDAPQPMHDLVSMLAALAGPAESGELAGEAAVRAAFSRAASPAGISAAARRPGRRRRNRGPARSRARLATALVVAVAGLGSVFAAYIDVLPSPIQQLAHVTVAAPAPPSSSPRHTGAAHTPLHRPTANQPSSQPDSRPQHSTSPAQRPGTLTPSPNYKPESPGRRNAGPSCTPVLGRSPSPQPKPTGRPSPPPSWSPPVHCTGLPTGPSSVPTLNPYPHLSGIPRD
jgi:hypothetical protein